MPANTPHAVITLDLDDKEFRVSLYARDEPIGTLEGTVIDGRLCNLYFTEAISARTLKLIEQEVSDAS